jgi:putative ABC transport system permease protein
MSVFGIALRNIRGNIVKSLAIFLCVFGVAAFFVATILIMGGAQSSLDRGLERLGADILVLPEGAEAKMESAVLMGKPARMWMPSDTLGKVLAVDGVDKASPQIYLQSLLNAHCCAVDEMFMVVFDPKTDFSVTPWLDSELGRGLSKGEVIGGTNVFVPEGEQYIMLYGYNLDLKGTLEPTGIGIDGTLFMTQEIADELARWSTKTAVQPLTVPPDSVSSVLVKVAPGVDSHAVAAQIQKEVDGVVALETPNLFGTFRQQMMGLLWMLLVMLGLAYIVAAVLIGLVFSMAAHERRREMALLRASGATPFFIFRTLWTEAVLVAAVGGVIGVIVSSLAVLLLRNYLAGALHMPFLFPSAGTFIAIVAAALGLSLLTATLAVLVPARRISGVEPALAMKE